MPVTGQRADVRMSDAVSGLPEDGELRLGPVTLPAGKRIWGAFVFCDECTLVGQVGLSDVSSITAPGEHPPSGAY